MTQGQGPIVCVNCFPTQHNWYGPCKCVQALCDSKNSRIEALEADNAILAAEVNEWRRYIITILDNSALREVVEQTDASGALMRAKGETDVQ